MRRDRRQRRAGRLIVRIVLHRMWRIILGLCGALLLRGHLGGVMSKNKVLGGLFLHGLVHVLGVGVRHGVLGSRPVHG